jgi:hypothetical protein
MHIICDNTITKYILVGITRHGERGLPKHLNEELLNSLMAVEVGEYTIGMTTAIIRVPNGEASMALHSAEMMQIGNQHVERKGNKSEYVSSDTRSDLTDTNDDAKKIHNQEEVMTWTAFILSVMAETEEDMQTAVGHITQVLGAKLVRNEIPSGKMEQVMKTALPFPYMPEWAHGNPLTKHAAILLAAQNVNTHSDDRGLRMGHIKGKPSQPLTIDLDKLPAKHLLAVGQTGSGKTTAILTYLARATNELHNKKGFTNVVFVTAKHDEGTNHRHLALQAGDDGVVIDIGPGKQMMNPLQIVYNAKNIKDTPFEWAAVVHRHVSLLTRFFAVFLEEGMSAPKRSYINESVIRLYAEYGIHVDRPETLKESLQTVKYPLMEDLIDLWIQDRDAGGLGDRMKTINSLINNTFQLSHNGALSYVNTDSAIDINKRVIVIDVSAITDERMREAMNVFTTGILWQKFRDTRKDGKQTIIAIDEARTFLKNPTTRADLINQLTQARSDNVAIWLMTQQLSDISKNDVEDEVKNNMFINLAFGPGRDESKIPLVKEYYNFTDGEIRDWVKCGVGEAMIMCQGNKSPVEIKLTDYELSVIKGTKWKNESTNQSTAIGSCIDERVQKLVEESGLCLASWCTDETDEEYFGGLGWGRQTFNSATGQGLVKAWVRPGLIKNGKVGSQSEDHYATVIQIAGWLLMAGISETIVHHTDNVDISSKIGDEWIAFEFEKPRSHTKDELMRKQQRAEENHSICYFIGVTENIKFLKDAVIKQNVFPRGTQLRRLMDNLIEERT